jgi:hypothetical protein
VGWERVFVTVDEELQREVSLKEILEQHTERGAPRDETRVRS